jgi:hypothetical protein
MNKSFSDITNGETEDVLNMMKSTKTLFHYGFEEIAKQLLNKFLNVNTFKVDYQTLKDAYLENIGINEIIDEEDTYSRNYQLNFIEKAKQGTSSEYVFYPYICKTYFRLSKEPRVVKLLMLEKSMSAISEIDVRLSEFQKRLDEITKSNTAEEIQKEKPIIEFYKEKNKKAKHEIIEFLKNDIDDYALMNSFDTDSLDLPFWIKRIPYEYDLFPHLYKLKFPNDLENKFQDISILKYDKVKKLYDSEDKTEFYSYLQSYIDKKDVFSLIENLLEQHHLLDKRKEIIKEAIETFKIGKKIIFANAIPSIIEGMLYDLCIALGDTEEELSKTGKGFQYKLNRLNEAFGGYSFYEYYSFNFRIIRNKVAHGNLTKLDNEGTASLMLLDLLHICELVVNSSLPINEIVSLTKEASLANIGNNYRHLFELLMVKNEQIPEFYNLEAETKNIEEILKSDDFWSFLQNELEKNDEKTRHGVQKILLRIKEKRNPLLDEKCKPLLQLTKGLKINELLVEDYISNLR